MQVPITFVISIHLYACKNATLDEYIFTKFGIQSITKMNDWI
jgi:hypothetical protein